MTRLTNSNVHTLAFWQLLSASLILRAISVILPFVRCGKINWTHFFLLNFANWLRFDALMTKLTSLIVIISYFYCRTPTNSLHVFLSLALYNMYTVWFCTWIHIVRNEWIESRIKTFAERTSENRTAHTRKRIGRPRIKRVQIRI